MTRARETADYGHRTRFENLIINGAFDIWQRGVSFSGITDSTIYTADRFAAVGVTGSSNTVSQTTQVPNSNFKSSLGFEVNTAAASVNGDAWIRYIAEGYDIKTFLNNYCVISFWVRSTITGTFCVAIKNNANDRSYLMEYTIASADTWQKVELSFFWDDTGTWEKTTNEGLELRFMLKGYLPAQNVADTWLDGNYSHTSNQTDFFAGAGNLFYLTGVQLERGSVATPFEFMPIGQELALCERYYQSKAYTGATIMRRISSANRFYAYTEFGSTMRTAPSLTFQKNTIDTYQDPTDGTNSTTDAANWTVQGSSITVNGMYINGTRSSGDSGRSNAYLNLPWQADAEF